MSGHRAAVAGHMVFCACVAELFPTSDYDASREYYALGRNVGRRVAELGFTAMTGGGPGLMEAVNRGAREAGGRSVGCNILLPKEQAPNPYLDRSVTCHYFFVRKVLLFKYSYAFIGLPGLGTLDELFEALTLIQNGKIEHFPVVLIGTEYWRSVTNVLRHLAAAGTIDAKDLDLLLVTDSVGAAFEHIHRHTIGQFGLTRRPRRRSILLAEPHTPRAAGNGLPAQPSRPPVAPAG